MDHILEILHQPFQKFGPKIDCLLTLGFEAFIVLIICVRNLATKYIDKQKNDMWMNQGTTQFFTKLPIFDCKNWPFYPYYEHFDGKPVINYSCQF